MNKALHGIKKITPKPLWNALRTLRNTLQDIIESSGSYIRVAKYCGFDLYYNRNNALVKRIKTETIFEEKMCEGIVKELSHTRGGHFLDIGANIGLISLYVASKLPKISIDVFEPGPNQRGVLNRTVEANNLKNIRVHGEVLGDREEMVEFHIHRPQDAALDGLKDTGRRGKTTPIKIPMITLDSWWISEKKPVINVVKIDTEGSELLVLRGAVELLKEMKPTIFLEIEPSNMKVYPYGVPDIENFFKDIDYSLEVLTKDTYIARFVQK